MHGRQQFVRAERVQEVIMKMTKDATLSIYKVGISRIFCVQIQCIQDPEDSVCHSSSINQPMVS